MPLNKVEASKNTLNRMVAAGKIVRLFQGQFYNPEKQKWRIP